MRAGEQHAPLQGARPLPKVLAVAIIEDQEEIRAGLRTLINRSPGFRCTGAFGTMEEALARILADVPQIALVDIGLPGISGTEGIPLLRAKLPNLISLILSVYDDDERIFAALCAGASGYLLKKTPPEKLLESLREAAQGGAPMSPEVARRVIAIFRGFRPAETAGYNLTPHELRLLQMLVEGHNYKTAAAELGVTVNTISFHMKNVYDKLHVHSKSEAVAKALRTGLLR